VYYFRESEKFEQEQVERRQQELESLRAEEMTPSEDCDSRPLEEDTLPPSEDLQQEMVCLGVELTICLRYFQKTILVKFSNMSRRNVLSI